MDRKGRNNILQGKRAIAGNTLMEMIVTLAIIGLLLTSGITFSIDLYENIEKKQFNTECEQLLNEILAVRNSTIMTNGLPSGCKFYRNSVMLYYYSAENKRQSRTMVFKTFTIKEVSGVMEIRFDASGTVSKATTLTLVSKNGAYRQCVFQPVTGRIYLRDAK